VGFQLAGRAQGNHFAMVHDGDAVAEAFGFLDVVGGHQDGFFLVAKFLDDVVNLAANLGSSPAVGSRETRLGIVNESHGKARRCFWPRKALVKRVALIFQAEALEQLFGLRPRL